MRPRLTHEGVNRSVSDMWDALADIPHDDPDRDHAIEQGREAERKLRLDLALQERMDAVMPQVFEALEGGDERLSRLLYTEAILREAKDLASHSEDPDAFLEGIKEATDMCDLLRVALRSVHGTLGITTGMTTGGEAQKDASIAS